MPLRVLLLLLVTAAPTFAQQEAPPSSDPTPRSSSSSDAEGGEQGFSSSKGNPQSQPSFADEVMEMTPYDPHKAEKAIEVGNFYFKRKNYRAALDRFKEALQYKPHDPQATFLLAQTQEKLKQLQEAYANYMVYLKLEPEGEHAAKAKAAADGMLKKIDASGVNPNIVLARRELEKGEAAMEQNNFPAAVMVLREATRLDDKNARAAFRLAQALENIGEFTQAVEQYGRYLDMAPQGEFAQIAQASRAKLLSVIPPAAN